MSLTLSLRKRSTEPEDVAPDAAPAPALPTVLTAVALPRVNLLPPEILAARRFRDVKIGLAGAVVGCVGLVALLYVGATGAVTEAQGELDTSTAMGQQLRTEAAKYQEITAVRQQADAAAALVTKAMGAEIRFSQLMSELSTTLPEDVWLQNIAFTQTSADAAAPAAVPPVGTAPAAASVGNVTFAGTGFSHDNVAAWLESLDKVPTYADPYFSKSTESLSGPRKVVTFQSTATLTTDALSRRYVPAGG